MRDSPYFGLLYVLVPFSLVSVGGGPAIFAPLQHQSVDIWHWVSAREFVDLFAIARTAPGRTSRFSSEIVAECMSRLRSTRLWPSSTSRT